MILAISGILAFVVSGVLLTSKDLSRRAVDRPSWALRPTLAKAAVNTLTWWARPFIDNYDSTGRMARAAAFGLLAVATQMTLFTALTWYCIALAGRLFDNAALIVTAAAVFILIGGAIVLPIATILTIPLTLLLSLALDWLFPLGKRK